MIADLTIAGFLEALLRVNLAGAAAVLAVSALRQPARRLFGAQAAYRIWALVILAGVAVLLPPRTTTAPAHTAPVYTAAATVMAGPAFAAKTAPRLAATAPTLKQLASPQAPVPIEFSPAEALFAVWLIGALLSVAVLVWRQRRFLATLGRLRRSDDGLMLAERIGVGPAVVGCLAPRVVVPADFVQRFTQEEQAVVLAHENAHLARQDARANGLLVLAQCLCWFNPLAHLAARLVRLDQELACDALVVRRYPAARRRYAEALLKTQIAATPLPLGCYWPSRARHPLEERIAMLKTPAPSAARRLAGIAATLAVCLAGGVAAWASQPAQVVVAKTAPWSLLALPHTAPAGHLTQAAPAAPPAASEGADPTGDWIGAIKSPDLRMAFHIRKTAAGFDGTLDSPDQAAYGIPLDHVVVTGDALSFGVPKVHGTYTAKWDADAHSWVGQWSQASASWQLSLAQGTFPPPPAVAGLDGGWDTQLTGAAGTLRLGFNIVTDAHGTHGTMDSPDQAAYALPLSAISRDGADVTIGFKLSDVTITGALSADGKTITGTFTQFGGSTPVVLTRRAPGAAAPYPAAHAVAQAPKPPVVDVDPKVLAVYAGTYRFAPGLEMTVTIEDGKLFAQLTNQAKVQLFASSSTDFFWKQVDAKASFAAPSGGQAPYVVLHQGARYLLGQRG
jgi:beta-lactamase regulating signal transducer with metallopeptidase domain